jgi:hypothetical protein
MDQLPLDGRDRLLGEEGQGQPEEQGDGCRAFAAALLLGLMLAQALGEGVEGEMLLEAGSLLAFSEDDLHGGLLSGEADR